MKSIANLYVDTALRLHHIHKTIRGILNLAPTSHSHLFPILEELFPHKRFNLNVQKNFVSQLLLICEYIPSIQHQILDLLVSKCLEMDVEIVIEDSGDVMIHEQYEGEIEGTGEDLFSFDEDTTKLPSQSMLQNNSGMILICV